MENTHNLDPLIVSTLYGASLKGDVIYLVHLLEQRPLLLDRVVIEKSDRFMQSPLHIASNLGHLDFVRELLRVKPDLAKQLDKSTRSSALHLASAKGHLDIVTMLIEVNASMCLARDQNGWNPVHVAAISSQLHVLDFLVGINKHAAREKTNSGETVLHLCVKYGQFECLKYLVGVVDDFKLLNSMDADGNTVLHLAVVAKQLEVVKFLVTNKKLKQSTINHNGVTAIDWLIQSGKNTNDNEILLALKRPKAFETKRAVRKKDTEGTWLKKQSNALMVVASLIATMAFQTGVNPPGGFWQDDSNPDSLDDHKPHLAGTSIMAYRDPGTIYKEPVFFRTLSTK